MHAIKVGWVGQTFALAKCNDSGGRKSRIRRSKQERKGMVESFIKKYQTSNNGNFPSLNLTHKEVGGSFYTVREIVREIIQENRVLGPAKMIPEEQNIDQFLEQYPLGSISTEPQIPLSISSNDSNGSPVSNHLQVTTEEPELSLDGLYIGTEHLRSDNGRLINGSHIDVKNEESDKPQCAELKVSESMGVERSVEELAASTIEVTPLAADVIVETFPIRPVTKPTDCFDGSSAEARDLAGTLEEIEIEKVNLGSGNGSSPLDGSPENSSLVDAKGVENLAGPLLERNYGLVDEKAAENLEGQSLERKSGLVDDKAVENLDSQLLESKSGLVDDKGVENRAEPLLESSNRSTTNEGTMHDTQVGTDAEVKVSHNDVLASETYEQSQVIAGTKAVSSPNGIHSNGTCTRSHDEESITQEPVVVENKADVQLSGKSQKGSNPTLDRINLESWEEASKSSAESETNPVLAILKSFIAAFVKFWSE